MQAIFNCSDGDLPVLYNQYKALIEKEFYDGDIGTSGEGPISLFLEKGLNHPITVVHLTTPNRVTYRRTHRHIRNNQVDRYIVWLVQRGSFRLSRSSGTIQANEGQMAIYDSSTPFFAEIHEDERGLHDSFQAVIPAHMFREYVAGSSGFNQVLDSRPGPLSMTMQLLEMMAGSGHLAGKDFGEGLAVAFLEGLGECLATQGNSRKSITDQRLEDIEEYVSRNLTDRSLSANTIAEACNISPRYLCYILKSAGYTFSQLVWDKRLRKARKWLISPKMQNYLVHEIASMAGYKSAAHFSRAFKATYGCTPSEYREKALAAALSDEKDDLTELASDGTRLVNLIAS